MSWAKQSEEMLKNWTNSQQQVWDQWVKMVNPVAASPVGDTWSSTIDALQQAVTDSMAVQEDWMKMWIDSLTSIPDLPEAAVTWAEQAEAMNERWSSSQNALWENWFTVLRRANPNPASGWEAESRKAFEAWQKSAEEILKANQKLTESWSKFGTTPNGK